MVNYGYSIDYIISKLNITKDDVYDLGSGNGNVCAQFYYKRQ